MVWSVWGTFLRIPCATKNYDDRFSHSNKEWAEQVGTPENNARIIKFRADWVVTSHSAVLDGFVTMYREKLEKQKE